jgi:hypothetical protein
MTLQKEHPSKILLTKRELVKEMGYSMQTLYRKVFTADLVTKKLKFKSLKQFKKIKTFNYMQSKRLRDFIAETKKLK